MQEFPGRLRALLSACAWLTLACGMAVAQPAALRLAPEAPALRIDGRLDEPAWQAAPVYDDFVQYLPVERATPPPGYRTTLQIVVEEHALVFGLRAWDPRPHELRAPLMRRDQVRRDQDFVAVLLDPVGTRRSAQFWRINAAGTLADGMFIADTDKEDFAPDFEAEAAAARLPDGYSVELRVPLLTLRYPYDGALPWRVMATRSIPRESSTLLLSAPLSKDALNFIAELQPVTGLEDATERARSHALLSVRPELTLRGTRRRAGAATVHDQEAALGAEIKWRPRADWVIDATLNPDFSQVELDVPQLSGGTRFALSVPEKRPFFLESTDVLDLPLAAFYSRSVTDPGWGLRATYRGARADATALTLRDDGGGTILEPGPYGTGEREQLRRSQASLLRGRWHGERSTTGWLLSERHESGGAVNRVAGADLVWRPADDRQLRLRALGSHTAEPGAPRQDGHHLHAAWWQRVPGWNWTAEATEISPGFRNRNGFLDQAGVRIFQSELIRRWGEVEVGGPLPFTAHEFENYLWWQHKLTLADPARSVPGGQTVARAWHPGIWLVAARNTEAWVHLRFDAERARPEGRLHAMRGLAFSYAVNPAPWFTKLFTEVTLGRRLDAEADRTGRGAELLAEAQWRATLPNGWGLESEQRVEQNFVDGPDGRRALTESAARWLGVLHLDARDSLRLVWQGSRFVRPADEQVVPTGVDARSQTASLVFQRRYGVGRSLSIGASRLSERPAPGLPGLRDSEVFAKWSFAVDR